MPVCTVHSAHSINAWVRGQTDDFSGSCLLVCLKKAATITLLNAFLRKGSLVSVSSFAIHEDTSWLCLSVCLSVCTKCVSLFLSLARSLPVERPKLKKKPGSERQRKKRVQVLYSWLLEPPPLSGLSSMFVHTQCKSVSTCSLPLFSRRGTFIVVWRNNNKKGSRRWESLPQYERKKRPELCVLYQKASNIRVFFHCKVVLHCCEKHCLNKEEKSGLSEYASGIVSRGNSAFFNKPR